MKRIHIRLSSAKPFYGLDIMHIPDHFGPTIYIVCILGVRITYWIQS